MTATIMCSNFGGFRCRPPVNIVKLLKLKHKSFVANEFCERI